MFDNFDKAMEEKHYLELKNKAIEFIKQNIGEKNSTEEIETIIENINIQNIELELQNDELIRTNYTLSVKENELLQAKNQYQSLFEFAPVGYVILNSDIVIVDCNYTFSDLVGFPKNHILSKEFSSFISKNHQDNFYFYSNKLLSNNSKITIEVALRTATNEEYFVELETKKIKSESDGLMFQMAVIDINEKKSLKNEKELLSERLKQTLIASGTAWWEWDMITNKVNYSDQKATMLGYTIDEFPIDVYEIMKYVHPDDYEPTMEAMKAHLYGKAELYEVEYRIKAKDGSYRWYYDKGRISERTPDGKPLRLIGTVVDVTDKKRNYELFIKAFHLSSQLMIISRISDQRFIEINKTFELKSGYLREEIVGKTSLELGIYKNLQDREMVYDLLKNQGYFKDLEIEFLKKNQEQFFGLVSGDIIFLNEEPHLLITIADVTAEKLSKIALNNTLVELNSSKHFLHTLIDSIPAPIFYKDVNGIYLGCNKAFCDLLDLEESDIVGKSVFDITKDPVLANQYHQKDMDLIESKSYQVYESSVKLATGSFKEVVFYKAIFNNIDGSVGGLIGTILDITERKKIENELKKSEEKYRELNSAKDKFFSIISHDLRNPFNILLNYSEQLSTNEDSMTKERKSEIINDIRQSAKSVYALIENLLEWARTQTGNMSFKPDYFDLYEVVYDAIYTLSNAAKLKNISINSTIQMNSIIFADYNMIKTVVRNILSNAIKFTYNNGLINIQSEEINRNDKIYIKLTISDNGIGINADDVASLFKIDSTVSKIGTNNEQGTSLGLILCKEFVDKNNGYIEVESELGKGSAFSIFLLKE